jgi:hypothetical protein
MIHFPIKLYFIKVNDEPINDVFIIYAYMINRPILDTYELYIFLNLDLSYMCWWI